MANGEDRLDLLLMQLRQKLQMNGITIDSVFESTRNTVPNLQSQIHFSKYSGCKQFKYKHTNGSPMETKQWFSSIDTPLPALSGNKTFYKTTG